MRIWRCTAPRRMDEAHTAFSSRRWTRACTHVAFSSLRCALASQEFEVYYQPIINLANNAITSFEALIRWHHPERGMIPPAEFVPLAEEIGLIVPLGEWVIRKACVEAAKWPKD